MKRVFLIFIFIQVSLIVLCQFSLDLTAGAVGMRRNITRGVMDTRVTPSLSMNINYKFESIPLEINLTPYFMSSARYEEHNYSSANYESTYSPIIIVMSGAGTSFKVGKILEIFTSFQLGYWYTKSSHYFDYYFYPNGHKTEVFNRKTSQLAIGPKLGIRLGKRRWKAIIQYEEYFLSAPSIWKFGKERYIRFSLGLSYFFGKRLK